MNLTPDERTFNYRCSNAQRVVENAFGILANRIRCLLTNLMTTPETSSTNISKGCVIIHNLMRIHFPNLQNADLDQEQAYGVIVPVHGGMKINKYIYIYIYVYDIYIVYCVIFRLSTP